MISPPVFGDTPVIALGLASIVGKAGVVDNGSWTRFDIAKTAHAKLIDAAHADWPAWPPNGEQLKGSASRLVEILVSAEAAGVDPDRAVRLVSLWEGQLARTPWITTWGGQNNVGKMGADVRAAFTPDAVAEWLSGDGERTGGPSGISGWWSQPVYRSQGANGEFVQDACPVRAFLFWQGLLQLPSADWSWAVRPTLGWSSVWCPMKRSDVDGLLEQWSTCIRSAMGLVNAPFVTYRCAPDGTEKYFGGYLKGARSAHVGQLIGDAVRLGVIAENRLRDALIAARSTDPPASYRTIAEWSGGRWSGPEGVQRWYGRHALRAPDDVDDWSLEPWIAMCEEKVRNPDGELGYEP